MKIVLLLIIFAFVNIGSLKSVEVNHEKAEDVLGTTLKTCCFCVTDEAFFSENECKTKMKSSEWMKECQQSKMLTLKYFQNNPPTKMGQCEELKIYGTFHGNDSYAAVPFDVSAFLAYRYEAKKVCYDGTSCLIFDNHDLVRSCARNLLKRNKVCEFEVSGNQNVGYRVGDAFGSHPKVEEIPSARSRTKVSINKGKIVMKYGECHKKGTLCARDSHPHLSTMFCMEKSQQVVQTCCKKTSFLFKNNEGVWSEPGKGCI